MATHQDKMPDYHNVFNYFNSVCCTLLLNNIYTMQVHNDTLEVMSNTNQALTVAWTSGGATGVLASDWNTISGSAQEFFNFVTGAGDFAGRSMTQFEVSNFSAFVGTALMNLVATFYNTDPVKGSATAINNAVNSMNSIISSQANYEEQPGQNLVKTEGSVLAQDTSAQQTQATIGTTIGDALGANPVNILQQAYN